jgi:methionyl-tRNA formyltransferase
LGPSKATICDLRENRDSHPGESRGRVEGTIMRIAFMGTPAFALPALEVVEPHLVCVYTQPPRPAGRGKALQQSPVHAWAAQRGVEVRTPANLKDAAGDFAALNLDLAVVAAYGLLLPQAILDAPRLGCWNIHPSLLPRWRGPTPVQYALWRGDAQTGVSLMRLVRAMDAGPIIEQRTHPIGPHETFTTLNAALWALGAEMLGRALAAPEVQTATPQRAEGVTYCKLLTRGDGVVDWAQSAAEIDRQIRALTPWPGTRTAKGLKILEAAPVEGVADAPQGTLLDISGRVACGGGSVLHITRLQPPGARAMAARDAVNGGYLPSPLSKSTL